MPVQQKPQRLVFVYNADSGLFNTMADIAHKIFSPATYQCNLCKITHGNFSMRTQWKEFIESLSCDIDYLHKDEFEPGKYLQEPATQLDYPLILAGQDGHYRVLVDARAINDCGSLDELTRLIASRIGA